MNCTRLAQVLDAFLDDELDRATGDDIAQHLGQCAACTARRSERDALRQQLRADVPYFQAPEALKRVVRQSIAAPRGGQPRGRARPSWLQAGALVLAAALMSAIAGYWFGRPVADDPLREQVVASHVASLSSTSRLTDVASFDRHVLKPWFQGKVDFAPVVRDLSAEGFALVGARLDHVGDHQAAAIVYRVRSHVVNLFVWRAGEGGSAPLSVWSLRGFGVATWAGEGLRFGAVSDLDPRELERFARLVQAQQP